MPYANNEGVRIHYEVEGNGPPLVLMYGIFNSTEFWYLMGYVEPLRRDYRLILVDTRGHGRSDKPHDPESYGLPLLAADVVAVLDDLNIGKAHYLGYSMGGFIGYGIARYAPERFHSLILGGAVLPWKRDPELPAQTIKHFKLRQGKEAFMAALEMIGGVWMAIAPEWEPMLRSNDLDALTAMLTADQGILSHGFQDVVSALTLPCLFYVGESDESPETSERVRQMPNITYVSFPGLDHIEAMCRADLVLPHVTKFLAGVGTS